MENKLKTMIVHGDWFQNMDMLTYEQQNYVMGEICRYGTGIESQCNDPMIMAIVGMLKDRIDFSQTKYQEKVDSGQKGGGRNKKFSDEEIYKLAKEGKKSEEIANLLGCSKSTVDKSNGWKHRHEEDFFVF